MVECCLHLANVLYLLSFLRRDMLWLRALTCGGLVLGIVFFSCQPTPLYGPTAWHVVFLIINAVQIVRLVRERRAFELTPEQENVAAAAFRGLSRDELVTLLARAMCRDPECLRDIPASCRQPLTPEEQALRDIAFSRLSRREIKNLLTRKLWDTLKRWQPARWRRKDTPPSPVNR